MSRGDVVLVDLPRSRAGQTREQFGTRPAIVLQDEPRLSRLSTVFIAPLASKL